MGKFKIGILGLAVMAIIGIVVFAWEVNTKDVNAQNSSSLTIIPGCDPEIDFTTAGENGEAGPFTFNGVNCTVYDVTGTSSNLRDRKIVVEVMTPYQVGSQFDWDFDEPTSPVCNGAITPRIVTSSRAGNVPIINKLGLDINIDSNRLHGTLKAPSGLTPNIIEVNGNEKISRWKVPIVAHSSRTEDRTCHYRIRYTIWVEETEIIPPPTLVPTLTPVIPPTPYPTWVPDPTVVRDDNGDAICNGLRYGHSHRYNYGSTHCMDQDTRDRYNLTGNNGHNHGNSGNETAWLYKDIEPHDHD